MGVQVSIDPGIDGRGRPLSEPNDKETIWPEPHDAKIDIREILAAGLMLLELDDVPVVTDGSFNESLLTTKTGESVPVITIARTGDVGQRKALGDRVGTFIGGENPLLDCNKIVPDGQPVDMFAEWSLVSVDITVSDIDANRANQMYLIIKYIMLAGQKTFRDIGYIDVIRTNGVDQVQPIDSIASGLIHTRTLTYQLTHPDFIASLPTLVNLVKQTLTIKGTDGLTHGQASTDLGPEQVAPAPAPTP